MIRSTPYKLYLGYLFLCIHFTRNLFFKGGFRYALSKCFVGQMWPEGHEAGLTWALSNILWISHNMPDI